MTTALCLKCGELKWGALCSCPKCHSLSSGGLMLDMVFSDRFFAAQTLKELGSVAKKIHLVCQDPDLAYWVFISYVSENHPSILTIDLKPEMRSKVAQVMQGLALPEVKLRESGQPYREPGEDDKSHC